MARPTKLTAALQATIVKHIVKGNFREVAAGAVGIPATTFSHWMSRLGQPYEGFRQAVLEAEKTAEIKAVERIIAAGARDPKHLEWWLERKFPDRWGRRERVTLDVNLISQEIDQAREMGLVNEEEAVKWKVWAVADAEAQVRGKR